MCLTVCVCCVHGATEYKTDHLADDGVPIAEQTISDIKNFTFTTASRCGHGFLICRSNFHLSTRKLLLPCLHYLLPLVVRKRAFGYGHGFLVLRSNLNSFRRTWRAFGHGFVFLVCRSNL